MKPLIAKDNIVAYQSYKDPHVRALVWSLISPGLVIDSSLYPSSVSQQWCQQIYDKIQPFLLQLDQDSSPLTAWLDAKKSWRLGVRFEAYWSFILEQLLQQAELERYESHIQVQEKKSTKSYVTTLGEMDFVSLDKCHQLSHLEIALKFYCLKEDESGYQRLIGPNANDWLERKLEHLFNKQLALSDTPQGQKKLIDLFYPQQSSEMKQIVCQQQGLVKGMIFFPLSGGGELNEKELSYINPDLLTGTWATQDNWYLSDPAETGRWLMLEKLDWLVPQVYSTMDDSFYTAKEIAYKIKMHFNTTRRSVLIVQLDYDEEQQLWLEQQRVMLVDSYWPSFLHPA